MVFFFFCMAGWLGFHKTSVICKKTENRVNHYKHCVLKMSNEWLQMGVKEAMKLVLRSGMLRLGHTLGRLIGYGQL